MGAFTDPNLIAPISDFSATINWGDATMSSGTISQLANGTFIVTGSHTYAEDTTGGLPHQISFTVQDKGGASLANADGAVAIVADAPLASQGATIQAVEGMPFSGVLVATVTDSNSGRVDRRFHDGGGLGHNRLGRRNDLDADIGAAGCHHGQRIADRRGLQHHRLAYSMQRKAIIRSR